jgi:hypothetical protein
VEVGISVGSIYSILHKPAQWSLMAKNYLAKHDVTALEYQPYFLDLSPPDFLLFP